MNTTLILAIVATAGITATVSVNITTYNAEAQYPTSKFECMAQAYNSYLNHTGSNNYPKLYELLTDSGVTDSTSEFLQAANMDVLILVVDTIDQGNRLNYWLEMCNVIYD